MVVKLENMVVEAILDTGGAKTIVSHDLAHNLNWEVETPPKGKSFGSYLGLGGKPTQYFGHILGPVGIRFGPDIVVNIWEIKVVEHVDPLFLIGEDILCGGSGGQNTCFNSIQALGGGHREVEFTMGPSTKTAALHWAPFRRGHEEVVPDCQQILKKWFQKKALS